MDVCVVGGEKLQDTDIHAFYGPTSQNHIVRESNPWKARQRVRDALVSADVLVGHDVSHLDPINVAAAFFCRWCCSRGRACTRSHIRIASFSRKACRYRTCYDDE